MTGIYSILHVASQRRYIGSSVNVRHRLETHCYHLDKGNHRNTLLQIAWNENGASAFAFELLEEVNDDALLPVREQFYLDTFRENMFNIVIDVRVPMKGRRHSPETLIKMSVAQKGHPTSAAARAKIGAANRGLPRSEAWRKHHSNQLTGQKRTEETRALMRANHRGMVGLRHSLEVRAKMSADRRGRIGTKHSDETRAKIGAAHRGKSRTNLSAAARANIGAASRKRTGWKHTPEALAKMTAYWQQRRKLA